MDEKPYLILTVGLPRSGKSTWARDSGFPIVSPDAIRQITHGHTFILERETAVWSLARLMVRQLFAAGCPIVVLDACSHTEKRRAEWICAEWETFCLQFDIPAEECIQRAIADERQDLIPVIERMAAAFEPLPAEYFRSFEHFAELAQQKWGQA